MNSLLTVALLALIPISEVRGAIPYGMLSGEPMLLVILVAILFNILVFPIVFLFLNFANKELYRFRFYKKHVGAYLDRVHGKVHKKVERYGYLGLTLFVGLPLPFTGAYTGSIGAWLLGMDRKKSFFAVCLGVLMAAAIVTGVMLTGAGISRIFIKS